MKHSVDNIKHLVLTNRKFSIVLLILIIITSAFIVVSYKYLALRTDYGRVISLIGGAAVQNNSADSGNSSVQKYLTPYQDPDLIKITQELGIHKNNIQGVEMVYTDKLTIKTMTDGTKPIFDPIGVFIPGYYADNDNGEVKRAPKIEIDNKSRGETLHKIVAHEFLHHMYASWWNKDMARNYDQDLILFYINTPSMHSRLSSYTEFGGLKLTEIYAYACTEYSDQALGSNLATICGQWFDRSKLVYYY